MALFLVTMQKPLPNRRANPLMYQRKLVVAAKNKKEVFAILRKGGSDALGNMITDQITVKLMLVNYQVIAP